MKYKTRKLASFDTRGKALSGASRFTAMSGKAHDIRKVAANSRSKHIRYDVYERKRRS